MTGLCRSALYLPATNARALAKAKTLACDVVILDLEDSVAPDAKDEARAALLAAVAQGGFGARKLVARVNALGSAWGEADRAALVGAGIALLVPKIGSAADVAAYAAALPGDVELWAMVETAGAVLRLDAIAGCGRLSALVMGVNDLAKEMRAHQDAERVPFLGFLAQAVAAARAHGLAAIDGVFNDIGDAAGFERQCAQGAAFGFDGKTLIHPGQIAACNAAFSPSAAAIAEARAIVGAFDEPGNAGKGVIRLEGGMVERLHLQQAQALLEMADEIARRES